MASCKTWYILFLACFILNSCIAEEENDSETPPVIDETHATEESSSDEPKEEDNVVVLTDKNFDRFIKSRNLALVEFYAPWCGHCKNLAPKYASAAKRLKKNSPPVPLAKVDCTAETELANRFNIQGYPTIMMFQDGKETDYDGNNDEDGIVEYMRKRADPYYVPPKDSVIVLGQDNFTDIVDKEELMLVEFYAPWCGHCKKIAPHLEKASISLEKEGQIPIGKVDATVEKELAEKHGVNSYPTMKIFRKGIPSAYNGPREEPGISDYLRNQAGLPTTLYATMDDVKKYLKSNYDEPIMFGVFENEDDPVYKLYIEANNDVRDEFSFGHTFAKDAKVFFGLEKSAILIHHPDHLRTEHEEKYIVFKGDEATPEAVRKFYNDNQVPLVGHYQQHTMKRFWKRPLVLVFYDVNFAAETRSLTQYWRNKIVPVALKYPEALFAVADEEMFTDKIKDLGLAESGEDVNVGIYKYNGLRFAMKDEEFNTETLEEFVEDFYRAKLKPVIKSQAVAKKAPPGKVQVVVGNSFEDIVLDETKEVFIEFYAPWCGHCKKLEPTMVKLAKKLKNEKDIVIAKMDATANEATVPAYEAKGFPTIYYALPNQKKKPIKIDGGRELKDLMKFIEENSEVLKKKAKDEL